MPLELCPNSSNMTTLTADCYEVECACCTDCCFGCVDDGGTLVAVAPGTPMPSSSPIVGEPLSPGSSTENPAASLEPTLVPTGLFDNLRPALARHESPSTAPTTAYPSVIPSDTPSLIPSDQPSFMPSAAPSECIFQMSTDQSCYRKDEDTMVVSFHNCDAKPNDWVGLYSQRTLLLMWDIPFFQQEADLWVRTCGDQECTDQVTSGTVTFGEEGLRLGKAGYQVVLVRNGKANAISDQVIVSNNNCGR
jgi:hypothetical protein